MKFMIQKLNDTDSYVEEPSEKEADEMYRKVSGHVLRLSKGTR